MKYPVAPLKEKYIKLECCTAVILNAMLFVLKYWAGKVTGSLALISGVWNTLSGSYSSFDVLIGGATSQKPAANIHTFGHGRAEHFTAIVIGVLLAIVSLYFIGTGNWWIRLPRYMPLVGAHEICARIENALLVEFGYLTTVHPGPF
jgi:divalent metal cation (Fe/Co/Zn/Cd) transporter